jgi:hypothetical protein
VAQGSDAPEYGEQWCRSCGWWAAAATEVAAVSKLAKTRNMLAKLRRIIGATATHYCPSLGLTSSLLPNLQTWGACNPYSSYLPSVFCPCPSTTPWCSGIRVDISHGLLMTSLRAVRHVVWELGVSSGSIGETTNGQTRTTRRVTWAVSGRSHSPALPTRRGLCWRRCEYSSVHQAYTTH